MGKGRFTAVMKTPMWAMMQREVALFGYVGEVFKYYTIRSPYRTP
jgi:hypothetical protein